MGKVTLPLAEYPRPQLVRNSYFCLNGVWDYAITQDEALPEQYDGQIVVPFSPETPASGVKRTVKPEDFLYYHTEFHYSKAMDNDKLILHFGAVDQVAEVYINNKFAYKHVGGFLPFEFDIKPFIKKTINSITVRVKDYSNSKSYSVGKQSLKRGGIWYTPQSGIYMPVWIEAVPYDYVETLNIIPDIDKNIIKIKVNTIDKNVKVKLFNREYKITSNRYYEFKVSEYTLWTPETPVLYPFEVFTTNDHVKSYFAMRKFSTMTDSKGVKRLALNNKPLFMKGVLDQGYYKEGFLTPSSDQDYINDIKFVKKLGFNVTRKHIKIESMRFYYHCDRLGLIVWQDFVNGGSNYKFSTISTPLVTGIHSKDNNYKKFAREDEEGRKMATQEAIDTIKLLFNVPSIALWTIFNEGWGQFDSENLYNECLKIDNTRIYDHASGWHDQGISDVKSLHVYFKRVNMPSKKDTKDRAIILSECGGYSLQIADHTFNDKFFGYKKLKSSDELIKEYKNFINKDIIPNIDKGLSAFIYTELSDVEDELNGFITYDRKVEKVDAEKIKEINDLVSLKD